MIVCDFYISRPVCCPDKTDSKLLIDSDTVLALSFAAKCLQMIAGRRTQKIQGGSTIQ